MQSILFQIIFTEVSNILLKASVKSRVMWKTSNNPLAAGTSFFFFLSIIIV